MYNVGYNGPEHAPLKDECADTKINGKKLASYSFNYIFFNFVNFNCVLFHVVVI